MDFQERLRRATQRGEQARRDRSNAEAAQALSEAECKRLHSQYRMGLVEHIERCLTHLARQFPGFQFNAVMDDRGWGAAVRRDDFAPARGGQRENFFSYLEIIVRPFSPYQVLELLGKGTIRNKEVFQRSNYQRLAEVDLDSYTELVDLWVLEYAELFARQD
jgi:hypothetical protein